MLKINGDEMARARSGGQSPVTTPALSAPPLLNQEGSFLRNPACDRFRQTVRAKEEKKEFFFFVRSNPQCY
jgi:hypothetical protein